MKIKSNTLLLIVGILFVLVCGLSYFFYTKYRSMMKYINNQFQTYNFNMQNQMVDFIDQYKNFFTQNRPIVKSKEDEKELDNFIADLENTDEDDLELEKEIQEVKKDIKIDDVNEVIEEIVNDTETKALLKQENKLPSIAEEDFDSFVNDLTVEQEDIEDIDQEDEEELPSIQDGDLESEEEVEDSESEDEIIDLDEEVEDSDSEDELDIDLQSIEDDKEITIGGEVTLDSDSEEVKFEMLPPSPKVEPIKVELPPRCNFIFKRGKNKGNACGRKAHEDGRCKKHIGK